MYWEGEDWADIRRDLIDDVRSMIYTGFGDRPERIYFDSDHLKGIAWSITGVRVRRLEFYRDHWLYELSLDTPDNAAFVRVQRVRAYAVIGPTTALATAPEVVAEHTDTPPHARSIAGLSWTVTLINWKSDTIHGLNERLGIELRTPPAADGNDARPLDLARANEYLDFFTSFIVGDTGSPFGLLHGGTCGVPAHVTTYSATSFEEHIKEVYPYYVYDPATRLGDRRPADTTTDPIDTDDWDKRRAAKIATTVTSAGNGLGPHEVSAAPGNQEPSGRVLIPKPQPVVDSGDASAAPPPTQEPEDQTNEAIAPPQIAAEPRTEQSTDSVATAAAFVIYEDALFKAGFSVAQSAPGAVTVAMTSDMPVRRSGYAIAPIRAITMAPFDVVLLTESQPRDDVDTDEFLAHVLKQQKQSSKREAVRNLRVIGNVDLRALHFKQPVVIDDCEFLYPVLLDDVDADASVEFKNCTFAANFSARNATIHGDLGLPRSAFYGFGLESDTTALDVGGLRLEGNLDASRVRVHGTFNAAHARIDGRLSCSGIDQRKRHVRIGKSESEENPVGLCLHGARILQGVDMSCAIVSAVDTDVFRSRLDSGFDATALCASSIVMSGAIVNSADLSYSNISGVVNMEAAHISRAREVTVLRSQILSDLTMRCARMGELHISCLWVGNDFSAVGAKIITGIWGNANFQYRFSVQGRIQIGGIETAYINFRGARIAGALIVTTGRIGTLELGIDWYHREFKRVSADEARAMDELYSDGQFVPEHPNLDRVVCDWFPTELGALSVARVAGLRRLDVSGAQIGGALDSSIRLVHIDVNGDISCHVDGEAIAREVRDQFAEAVSWKFAPPNGSVETTVTGAVIMRKVRTRGYIDLTNVQVGRSSESDKLADAASAAGTANNGHAPPPPPPRRGERSDRGHVLLNDVRIGTDLFIRSSRLRGESYKDAADTNSFDLRTRCTRVQLDNARISGDAVLSGLDLRDRSEFGGRFTARNLRVGGQLEFATENRKGHALLGSRVFLTGLRAGELRLTRTNILDPARADLRLDRAKLGRLVIHYPIPAMNLQDAEIRTWDLQRVQATDAPTKDLRKAYALARRRHGEGVVEILNAMKPFDRMVWMRYEKELRNSAAKDLADTVYTSMRRAEARWRQENADRNSFRQVLRRARDFVERGVFGYGTRVVVPISLWAIIGLTVFLTISDPANVVASDGLLNQLTSQCRALDESSTATRARPIASAPPPANPTLPAKCVAYAKAARETKDPGIQLTATQLGSELGFAESLRLTARYAVPIVGAIGDPDWVPAGGEHDARLFENDAWHIPFAPATITFVAWFSCTVLAALVAGFYRDRWFKR